MKQWAKILSTSIMITLLAGCSFFGDTPDEAETPTSNPVVVKDGFVSSDKITPLDMLEYQFSKSDSLKKGKISVLHANVSGDTLRLVGAFHPSENREESLGVKDFSFSPKNSGTDMFITGEMWDTTKNTISAPLTNKGVPIATKIGTNNDSNVQLFYIDFPKPEGKEVRFRVGKFGDFGAPVKYQENEKFINPDEERMSFVSPPPEQLSILRGEILAENKEKTTEVQASAFSVNGASQRWKDNQLSLSIDSDVLFDTGSDKLSGSAKKVIESSAETLRLTAGGQTVNIVGHTDNKGTDKVNMGLSKRRADSVKKAIEPLLKNTDIKLRVEGKGSHDPLVPNTDAQGKDIEANQAKNRRVSFEYTPNKRENISINTGAKSLIDAPEAKEVPVKNGAIRSFIVQQKDAAVPMRIDVMSARKQDEKFVKIEYRFELADPKDAGREPFSSMSVFGDNGFGKSSLPGGANISILNNATQYPPVMAGDIACLCTEELPLNTLEAGESNTVFAYYPIDVASPTESVIRFANAGEAKINILDVLKETEEKK